jgi:hypothetical protein
MREKKNKFNAKKIEFRGMIFDSKKELERFLFLKDRESKGIIEALERQIEFELIPENKYYKAVRYIADFRYIWKLSDGSKGLEYIEDVKGLKKGSAYQVFKIKQKLMYDKFKILVKEI